MYGLIGKMRAAPGKREELLDLLSATTGAMPGCLSYIIARDPADQNAIWVTEVWKSVDHHKNSLKLPQVQAAISKARPIIVGFEFQVETEPLNSFGLMGA